MCIISILFLCIITIVILNKLLKWLQSHSFLVYYLLLFFLSGKINRIFVKLYKTLRQVFPCCLNNISQDFLCINLKNTAVFTAVTALCTCILCNSMLPGGFTMAIAQLLLLCAAMNIDSLSIGLSCGMGGIRLPLRNKLTICLVSAALTGAGIFTGGLLCGMIPPVYGRLAGALLLSLLGLYTLCRAAFPRKSSNASHTSDGIIGMSARILGDPSECDIDASKTIDFREAVVIGIALSADSFAFGIGTGISGGTEWFVPFVCALIQFLFLYIGEKTAEKLRRRLSLNGRTLGILSGLILIITGILRAAA